MSSVRSQVLEVFKTLHKTRKLIFSGDQYALEKARLKINFEFKNSKDVTDPAKIEELLNLARAVDKELQTTVVQAVEVKPGVYEAKLRKETVKLDNVPYKDCCSEQK